MLARAQRLFNADFARTLLDRHQHDVHQANTGNPQSERAHQRQQYLQGQGKHLELVQFRHQVGHIDGPMVRGAKVVGRSHGFTQVLLGQLIVAVVVEPDAVQVLRVLQVAHGVEGHVDLPVAVVVVAFLHLGTEHADNGEHHTVEADRLSQSPAAGVELGLGLRADDADVGALQVFGAIEKTARIGVQLPDILKNRANAIYGPGVGV